MEEDLTRAAEAPVPSVIDERYELQEQLGRGGFATVHRAHDRKLSRSVAIKILTLQARVPRERIEVVRQRFQREARVAAGLRHPSIIQILDVGDLGPDRPYVVMEELHGHDLYEHITRHGPMPPGRLLPMFGSCLMALHRAHEAGIVHKDLKPSNLFLCEPGAPEEHIKVLDFGIAFAHEEGDGRLTQTGELLGTPRYMAPEYIEKLEVSPALDVYQMALVLAEVLLGARLFPEQNMAQSMLMHLQGTLELPQVLREGPWAPVFAKALAYDPKERYRSTLDFARALEGVDWSGWRVEAPVSQAQTVAAPTPTAAVRPYPTLSAMARAFLAGESSEEELSLPQVVVALLVLLSALFMVSMLVLWWIVGSK